MISRFVTSNIYRHYWKAFFWLILAALLYLTLTPTPPKPIHIHNIDKLYHFCAFAGFSSVFLIAFRRFNFFIILTISVALGIGIEIAQIYIPGRGFSFWDMVADIAGALAGSLVAYAVIRKSS